MTRFPIKPSRRDVLTGLGAAFGAAALGGCGSSASEPQPGSPDASPSTPEPDAGARCAERSDLDSRELLSHIDTFVVLCMENRSFDHYLGALSLLEGRADVRGLAGTESNPTSDGRPIAVHELSSFTSKDPPHDWDAVHEQWNGGLNDGFVRSYSSDHASEVMGYYTRQHLPVLYALADAGVVCNHWYSSVLGPTWPNRYYLHGGTAHGRKRNLPPIAGFRSVFEDLDDAGISHTNYFHDVAWASGGYYKLSGLDGIEKFFDHARDGTLPSYCLIDPKFIGPGANDDHPSHDVRLGQALIGSVVAALAQSPQWERCLFALTYDEHGGFFDHIAPPVTVDERPEFGQLGIRVPAVVVGPTVRRGCATSEVLEHTSVVSTLTRRFDLEPLNERVAAAGDLSACIDPARIGDPLPPPEIPTLDISLGQIADRANAATYHEHHELAEALAARPIPGHLDRRGRDLEITRLWLEAAERVGAARLVE